MMEKSENTMDSWGCRMGKSVSTMDSLVSKMDSSGCMRARLDCKMDWKATSNMMAMLDYIQANSVRIEAMMASTMVSLASNQDSKYLRTDSEAHNRGLPCHRRKDLQSQH